MESCGEEAPSRSGAGQAVGELARCQARARAAGRDLHVPARASVHRPAGDIRLSGDDRRRPGHGGRVRPAGGELRPGARGQARSSRCAGKRIAESLWSELCACVRLQLQELREENVFTSDDFLYATSLRNLGGSPPAESSLASAVSERWALSGQRQRASAAHAAVRVIRQAMRTRYAMMVMPHSRDDHRVPIEQIYVARLLTPRPHFQMVKSRRARPGADERSDTGGPAEAVEDFAAAAANDLAPLAESEMADRRFVVVGHPGAGKSTFIRNLLHRVASRQDDETPIAPMVVELKDHQAPTTSYLTILADTLRVVAQAEFGADTIRDILFLGLGVIVFDGLDEIEEIDMRRSTVAGIEEFCRRYPLVTVVVTSREEGYLRARLDPALFPVYYLPDFTDEQLELYVQRWFRIVAQPRHFEPGDRVRNFLEDSVHVADLRTNPLMLSLLCMIYEYDGFIPENRPQVYEECAELLFERWDRMRRVPISFKSNTKTRYLIQELAYNFFNQGSVQSGLPEGRLKQNIKDYFERNVVDDAESASLQAQDFLDFCAGRAWLLAQTGTSERGERLFGFTHRTFLEYFAACFIVRHCNSARDVIGMIRPLIQFNTSEVVPQIAIQQFDARRADGIDDCLELLVLDRSDADRRVQVEFALRSLRFMRPSPRVLDRLYTAAILLYTRTRDTQLLALLLSCPPDTFPTARRSCRAILTGNVAVNAECGAAIVDELFQVVADGTVPAELARRLESQPDALAGTVVGLAPRIASSHPGVVVELCRRDLVPMERYVEAMGARGLLSVQLHGTPDETPGPLVGLLRRFFSAGELDPDLHAMLARIAASPAYVLPLRWLVLMELADIGRLSEASALSGSFGHDEPEAEITPLSAEMRPMFDDKSALAELLASDEVPDETTPAALEPRAPFEPAAVRRQFPIGRDLPPSSTGFYLLFLATMLAAYERAPWLGESRSGTWHMIGSRLPGFSDLMIPLTRVDKAGQLTLSRDELGACVIRFAPTLNCSPEWLAWFDAWKKEEAEAFVRH
ncbi:NACHT domain-containing protein [Amycolatopsis sp. RTGN1]|uniref:NACHT domain-containing protein n=1 Tax=Amycolatopsis ponsaeliensis TaxID=2992142 RepID=UPI0025505649|nr:NACHT domain-containing protein [Amycolatopsis sp. RTGN1]